MDESARALSALQALDPGCAREQWIRIGMAAKAAGLSLDEFTSWSSGAANYDDERDCKAVRRSFKEGAVTAATLYGMAFAKEWKDPVKPRLNGHGKRKPYASTGSPAVEPIAPQRADKPVAALWQRCAPADDSHPGSNCDSHARSGTQLARTALKVVRYTNALDSWPRKCLIYPCSSTRCF